MDPTSLLEQLKDVHSPATIGTWPPAIGWILLVLLVSISLVTIVWISFRWYRSNAWRREALKEYALLQQTYQQVPSTKLLIEISSLLKRCAASINHNSHILSMTGASWENQLQTPKTPLKDQEIQILCFDHYQAKFDQLNDDALLRIRKWIKTLKPFEREFHSNKTIQSEIEKTPTQSRVHEEQTTVALPNLDDNFENKTS